MVLSCTQGSTSGGLKERMSTRWTGSRGRGESEAAGIGARWQALALLAGQARVTLDLAATLQPLVGAVGAVTGFAAATLFVALPGSATLELYATGGVDPSEQARIATIDLARSGLVLLMSPDMALHPGKSYHIPPRDLVLVAPFTPDRPTGRDQGEWGPRDTLVVPLISATGQITALLCLCFPQHPKLMAADQREATLALVEAYGDILAVALDNALALVQAEETRTRIEESIPELLRQVDRARQGDLTVQAVVSESSLGVVADLFNQMIVQLQTSFLRLRETSQAVNSYAIETHELTRRVVGDAETQARHIDEVKAMIAEIAQSVAEVAQESENAAQVADDARGTAAEGRQATEEAVSGMTEVRATAERSSSLVKRLAEHMQEIETIVGKVTDFSRQANAMAVNAAIEANRSGDQSRGIATVAQEMRLLARHSADAAHQITARVAELQRDAAAVVASVDEGAVSVVQQSGRVIDAGAMLLTIGALAEEFALLSDRIRAATREEAAKIGLLVEAMQTMLSLTDAARGGVTRIDAAMDELLTRAMPLNEQFIQIALEQEPVSSPPDA